MDGDVPKRTQEKIKDLKWLANAIQPLDENRENDDGCGVKRSKALCCDDVCPRVLKYPEGNIKATLALEVVLSHHIGSDLITQP